MMITHLSSSDLSDLLELVSQSESGLKNNAIMKRYLRELPCYHAWGVRDGHSTQKNLIAYALFQSIPPIIELHDLFAHPDHRRKGHASALLTSIVKHALENKCTRVDLEVRESAIQAQKLYRSLGFVQVGERSGYYPSPLNKSETAFLFSLDLAEFA